MVITEELQQILRDYDCEVVPHRGDSSCYDIIHWKDGIYAEEIMDDINQNTDQYVAFPADDHIRITPYLKYTIKSGVEWLSNYL